MPKEIKDIREFLLKAKRPDVAWIKMKKTQNNTGKKKEVFKFKLRTSRYLFTLTVPNKEKADKVKTSLGEGKVKMI